MKKEKLKTLAEKEIIKKNLFDGKNSYGVFMANDVKEHINKCLNKILEPLTDISTKLGRKKLYKFQAKIFKEEFGELVE